MTNITATGTIDYAFCNFLCMCVLFCVIVFFIVIVRNLITEIDMRNTTPSDYTLMVSGLEKQFTSIEDIKNNKLECNGVMPYEINLTYGIHEYYQLKQKFLAVIKKIKRCISKNVRMLYLYFS